MMSICRNNSVNSFFSLPPPLEEDHFSQAFHQTLCMPPSPKTPSSFTPHNPSLILNPFKPIRVIESFDENPLIKSDGNKRSFGAIDLMSCTESLGFESSDEMISNFDDLGFWDKSKKNDNLCKGVSSNNEDGSSSSLNSSSKCCSLRRREKMVLKSEFPPPLTTLGENGKRNFMLKSVRKDGRLEINEVMIERPEFLLATRGNGRLRMHLIQNVTSSSPSPPSDDDDDVNGDNDDVNDEDDDGDGDGDDDETEEIDWKKKIQASGSLRRCFDHHHQHVWGPHQNRFVATI